MEHSESQGNTIHKILSDNVEGYAELTVVAQRRCCSAVIGYLFRARNLRSLVQVLSNETCQKQSVKVSVFQNGYLLKNVKLWLFYCYRHKIATNNIFLGEEAARASLKFEIRPEDIVLMDILDQETDRTLRQYAKKYKALTLEKLDATLVRIFQEIRTWCHKFIFRKLRFVMTSQSMTVHDIEYELIGKGIQGLMQMYPLVESFLHAVNIIKRTLHNHGINIITSYTHQKRARVLRGADETFYSNTVSYDAIQSVVTAASNELIEDPKNNDLKIDVEKLCERLPHKKRYCVRLLSGYECPLFTDWLRSIGKVRALASNTDLQERIPAVEYMKLIFEYLKVPFEKGMAFINRLKELLNPYRHSEPETVIRQYAVGGN